ncbi:MAG: right-handed parallel beta-helix repeat-containing protein, partial [Clostridia bacterium]|nr:right-handed parallel beta-helix repeat-containing protein [Clostridia bacterium]
RELKQTKTTGEIIVAFMGGDYGVVDNLTFTAEDSGNENLKITYCAYGDSDVYFTNGVYINEDQFTALEESDKIFFKAENVNDIKKVDLSGDPNADRINYFTPLSDSSSFCWVARTPNKVNGVDAYYPGFTKHVLLPESPYKTLDELIEAVEAGVTETNEEVSTHIDHYKLQTLHTLRDRLATLRTLDGVQLVGYIGKVWHQDAHNLTSFDPETGIVSYSNGPVYSFYATISSQQQAYLNNVSEELDDIGEYWIDPATKTLYVYKPQGNYSITTDGTFLTIQKRVNNISLVKLNFRICNNDGILAHGDNFTMDQCSVTYVGGTHALYSEEALNVHITSSTFAYCAETGVNVEGPEPGDREDHDYYALQNTGFVFDNNVIHDVNLVYVPVESGGIKVRWQIGAVVSHNEIYNSGRYGVDYKYGNIDCIFEYNYLHHCMQNSADGGAFYCGRVAINRGNVIRYNLVADIYATNPIHTGGTYAIYLDDAMENLICYGNVFYNSGTIMNNNGRGHDIHDNVFIGNTGIFGKAGYYDISKYHYGVWGNENWSNITRI